MSDQTRRPHCRQCDTATHQCPGCGADVEHGKVACPECNPSEYATGEHPGPALVVALVEAARALVSQPGWGLQTLFSGHETTLARAVAELEVALVEEAGGDRDDAGHWGPSEWRYAKPGDRVRIGDAEARISTVVPLRWVGTGARQIQVVLEGRNDGRPYSMPPSGKIDIWRPALPDWAALAFHALSQAGLTK